MVAAPLAISLSFLLPDQIRRSIVEIMMLRVALLAPWGTVLHGVRENVPGSMTSVSQQQPQLQRLLPQLPVNLQHAVATHVSHPAKKAGSSLATTVTSSTSTGRTGLPLKTSV